MADTDHNQPRETTYIIEFPNGVRLEILMSDLLNFVADALVNPANSNLTHGGGVAGFFRQKAGESMMRESRAIIKAQGSVAAGTCVATTAGDMTNTKTIIHVVGPNMRDPLPDDAAKGMKKLTLEEGIVLLEAALDATFAKALSIGAKSVAIPMISTGKFKFPKQTAADIFVAKAWDFCLLMASEGQVMKTISLVNIDEESTMLLIAALKKKQKEEAH